MTPFIDRIEGFWRYWGKVRNGRLKRIWGRKMKKAKVDPALVDILSRCPTILLGLAG